MKNFKGWAAIDAKEKILFNVYNASNGEPNPDILVEGKIRIVNSDNLIGFANSNGQVVIKPQFESVSTFYKGKAIIGKNCKEVPWDKHESENGCHHYLIVCRKHGYINTKGVVIKLGNFTFEKIMKEIDDKVAKFNPIPKQKVEFDGEVFEQNFSISASEGSTLPIPLKIRSVQDLNFNESCLHKVSVISRLPSET